MAMTYRPKIDRLAAAAPYSINARCIRGYNIKSYSGGLIQITSSIKWEIKTTVICSMSACYSTASVFVSVDDVFTHRSPQQRMAGVED